MLRPLAPFTDVGPWSRIVQPVFPILVNQKSMWRIRTSILDSSVAAVTLRGWRKDFGLKGCEGLLVVQQTPAVWVSNDPEPTLVFCFIHEPILPITYFSFILHLICSKAKKKQ